MRKIVVMPVYEDLEASSKLFIELARTQGPDTYVVAVDDGSVRQPLPISAIEASGLEGVVIRLRRNVGHQRAIAIGLSYVAEHFDGDNIVVAMDSDGEDTPESITALVAGLDSADVDVVVASRRSRVESLRFKAFYVVYKLLFSLLSGRQISFGNFMAAKMPAVRRLASMQELWIHVAACVLGSKLRVQTCALDRGPRYAGRSKMNFVGLALHGFRALMVFAEDVLVRVGIACTVVAALSITGGVVATVLKMLGFASQGWFSLAFGILVLVFLQTAALTLIILMLSGMMRSGGVLGVGSYREFVDEVLHATRRSA
ncbi:MULTISPECIES: glycosyltransferase [Stenotrophomonas]|uniref:Glycosyl transferase family 2 n=2 Tax=Stenotrophomonas maltophilia TaxID=40324 RepID=B4SJ48_STRM5|nr:glycosyltransferase [Stenotrophomonas maltophilia]ACF50216.1 glycosyl transferase family 2 [Stenotrophomonas maltophilia R551-3]MBN5142001.1 glycosyltransferase [Stenotrophomonas maltophilia]PJL09593.1 dolichol-phosphate mannosyltransferase [Stenotrophomonas maltophilia]PJL43480.1 dolichol-phosphate mannosyltransferase [Stenotrophomonas maltophilia]QGL74593.1 glycosyltransferase [Stenotrophomonas maltophilia]